MSEIRLVEGDCLEEMKNIPAGSVDLILCDLPYGTTACKWDCVIPFDQLWQHYQRIIKPNKPIVLFSSQPFTTSLIASNIQFFKEELIWLKNKGGSGFQSSQKHIKIHESICVFSYDNQYTFNPQKWLIAEKEFITQRKTFQNIEVGNNIYNPIKRQQIPDTGERNPLSVIAAATPCSPAKNKTYKKETDVRYHPTQKPLSLCKYLLETFSNVDDLVLDNCMGSGSTGVACKNTNRNFIGIELDPEYFKIAERRINEN